MTSPRNIQWFGLGMLIVTVLALWFNVSLVANGEGNPHLVGALGLCVGVGGFVIGEIWREA